MMIMSSSMKALVTAGGYATRLFPITRVLPKAMLPLGRQPMIQRVVEELHAAGVHWVGILCRPEQQTLREHVQTLEHPCTVLPFEATASFSDAMLQASAHVRGEPFLLALSDELDHPAATHTVSRRLVETFRRFRCTVVAYDRSLTPPEIAQMTEPYPLRQISDLERSPEDVLIVGRFLFAEDFLPALARVKSETGRPDYLMALDALGRQQRLVAMPFEGPWLHCSDHKGYQEAFIAFARADHQVRATGLEDRATGSPAAPR